MSDYDRHYEGSGWLRRRGDDLSELGADVAEYPTPAEAT